MVKNQLGLFRNAIAAVSAAGAIASPDHPTVSARQIAEARFPTLGRVRHRLSDISLAPFLATSAGNGKRVAPAKGVGGAFALVWSLRFGHPQECVVDKLFH
jgi:hypothetical protein